MLYNPVRLYRICSSFPKMLKDTHQIYTTVIILHKITFQIY